MLTIQHLDTSPSKEGVGWVVSILKEYNMNNFTLLDIKFDTNELIRQLDYNLSWIITGISGLSALMVHSPPPPLPGEITAFCDNCANVPQSGYYMIEVGNKIEALMQYLNKYSLGRCNISRLLPGCEIPLHLDQGKSIEGYTRYHITIQNYPGSIFYSGDEQFEAKTGDVFSFNNRLLHKVVNNSNETRYSLAVDLK